MSKTRWLVPAVAALVLLAAPHAALAQDDGGPQYLIVQYDQVDPSHAADFEANAREWVAAFGGAEMGPEWTWLAFSNQNFTYAWVMLMPDYAFLDTMEARQKEVVEKIGEEKLAVLLPGLKYLRSNRSEILKVEPELSYDPQDSAAKDPTFSVVGTHYVKPAMDEKFRELVKKVVAAFEKVEAPLGFDAYKVAFGQGSYMFVSSADSAGQLYSDPGTGAYLAEAYGAETAQAMYQEWASCITDYETANWNSRKELSYDPAAAASEGEGDTE